VVAAGVVLRPTWNFHDLHAGVAEPGRFSGLGGEDIAPAGRSAPAATAPPATTPRADAAATTPPQPAASKGRAGERVLYQREGPTATVAIVQLDNGDRTLIINARTNASDGLIDMGTQMLLAHIPLLLAPRTDDVFIIGWGSGVTVGAATQTPAKRITAVELEPAVVEASRFFDHANHAPLKDPRVRLYEDDARHILLASEDTYDVIISEPPHPWVAGVANLFTRDFYRLAQRRLRDGGVFTQWLQTYQITIDTYRSILATFLDAFPQVMIFHPPGGADTILVGSNAPLVLDLEELGRRWQGATAKDLARLGMMGPEYLLATLYLGPDAVRQFAEGGRINTDYNMYVEFRGASDMERNVEEAMAETFAVLEHFESPLETMVKDPQQLLASRERLEALVAGLRLTERDPSRFEQLARALPAAPR
jgi:spermidine synthase